MDPQASVSSQKTSPQSDPAALTQLTSELSAQANQLAIHQHQLTRLTALTEELVRSLQGLSLSPPAPDPLPVYYLCSVLFAVVNNLQMDPQASVSSQYGSKVPWLLRRNESIVLSHIGLENRNFSFSISLSTRYNYRRVKF